MSEPHEFPDSAPAGPPADEALWHQTRRAILDRVAGWIDTAAETEAGREQLRKISGAEEALLPSPGDAKVGDTGALAGLIDVVGSLTALRHEMKLQTKSHRGMAERLDADAGRIEAGVEQIVRAIDRLPEIDAHQVTRPLADSLADADEAVGRLREAIDALAADWPAAPPPPPPASWWGRAPVAAAWRTLEAAWSERHRRIRGLADGARLLSSRLESHLHEHHIERIGRVGDVIDPHAMQVLDVITDSQSPAGTVAQVLRPGYRHGNHVIRPAQVTAVGGQ